MQVHTTFYQVVSGNDHKQRAFNSSKPDTHIHLPGKPAHPSPLSFYAPEE